jgi:acetyl/propionyl-CoA carboxylase alpha subunit
MLRKVLIANRGEIAIRIARAAADAGVASVSVYSADDAHSLHRHAADESVALSGRGAAAYLDIDGIVAAARSRGCDAVHPGYGFLADDPGLAARLRRGGSGVHRASGTGARALRRQGAGPGARRALWRAGDGRHPGYDHAGAGP